MIAWLLKQRLFRYSMVGGIGFGIDSGLTVLQVSTGQISPEVARVPAFLVASFATYFLHQIWTFEGRSKTRYANGWITYLASTTLGALINYAVYYVLLHSFRLRFGACSSRSHAPLSQR